MCVISDIIMDKKLSLIDIERVCALAELANTGVTLRADELRGLLGDIAKKTTALKYIRKASEADEDDIYLLISGESAERIYHIADDALKSEA